MNDTHFETDAALAVHRGCVGLAVLLLGLMAGFFYTFAIAVAPAMTNLDASTYIVTQQWINRVVRNVLFAAAYFGAPLACLLAMGSAWFAGLRSHAWAWLGVALLYLALVFWVTFSINVPINQAVEQWNAASPPPDWVIARDRWNQSNVWRAIGSTGAFAIAIALAVRLGGRHRRTTQRAA